MNERELNKSLKNLCLAVRLYIDTMDKIMKESSTNERGQKVAKMLNFLELEHDRAWHFGLGKSLKKATLPTDKESA